MSLNVLGIMVNLVFASFATPMIVFAIVTTAALGYFSRKFGWRFRKAKKADVLKWAAYGAILPAWIVLDVVFSYTDLSATAIGALILAVLFIITFSACENIGVPFFPIPTVFTIAVMLALLWLYSPPSPENWYAYSNLPPRASDLIITWLWSAPPWVIGMAYIRLNPKKGALILPFAVLLYFVMFFYGAIGILGDVFVGIVLIYSITAVLLLLILQEVRS